MSEWMVALKGSPSDLDDLTTLLSLAEVNVTEEEGTFFLKAARFNTLCDTDQVRDAAAELLQLVNGAARLRFRHYRGVEADSIVRIHDDGTRQTFVSAPLNLVWGVRADTGPVTVNIDGETVSISPSTEVQSWVSAAARDATIAKALRMWGSEHNWYSLPKIIEVVQSDVGSRIYDWVKESEVDRVFNTANSEAAVGDLARHGHSKYAPPKKPISLREAEGLVRTILTRWLNSKNT